MAVKPSPTTLRRQLGAELRRLRDSAGRTVADVASTLGWSESKLSRIETAHTGIRNRDLDALLDLYAVAEDDRRRLRGTAVQSRQRAWWEAYGDVLPDAYETYIGFEAEATAILVYEAQLVHGLLQTAEYANAIMQAYGAFDRPDVIDQRVAVRMARQAVLSRDPAPHYVAIFDEAVLRRPIGGPEVQRRQMQRLVELAEHPAVRIQVLPFETGAHRALSGSFTILEFSADAESALVYSESMIGGSFFNRPDELRAFRMGFEALRTAALPPRESTELIRSVAKSGT